MSEAPWTGAVEAACDGLSIVGRRPVAGGCISEAWWIDLADGSSRFLKLHGPEPDDLFQCEAEGLRALEAVGAVRVPSGAVAGSTGDRQFIVMEAISEGVARPGFDAEFGRRFAELHRDSASDRFGFARDNYIGATRQPNGWLDDWVDFVRRRRLGHQIELARERGRSTGELDRLVDRLLDRLDELVVKPVAEAGGYGIVIGSRASDEELAEVARSIEDDPRGYIAQEIVQLSTHPTLVNGSFEPRHIDLRPFVLSGADGVEVIPGGLTRVALREGSLIVNSSQGGGSKDTWVLQEETV